MPRLKFVQNLPDEIRQQLEDLYRHHASFALRQRAHAILLSAKGFTIPQLHEIFAVDRDTISAWITRFEPFGIDGWHEAPRSGRPPIYTEDEVRPLQTLIDAEPRQIKPAPAHLEQATGEASSTATLQRALKKLRYAWRRCRRSVNSRRDPIAFARAAENQQALQQMADHGLINRFDFDASGFATGPCVPYAWQPLGVTRELPSFPSQRLNILGFLSRDQQAFFEAVEGTVGTDQAIAAFDRFAADDALAYAHHGQPCVVVLDNAPWPTSRDFRERLDRWGTHGVILHDLPPYCPELNLIEILWRKIKYDWLPLSSYTRDDDLKNAVLMVLSWVGYKYQISFA